MAEILFYNPHLAKDYQKFTEICDENGVKIIEVDDRKVEDRKSVV